LEASTGKKKKKKKEKISRVFFGTSSPFPRLLINGKKKTQTKGGKKKKISFFVFY